MHRELQENVRILGPFPELWANFMEQGLQRCSSRMLPQELQDVLVDAFHEVSRTRQELLHVVMVRSRPMPTEHVLDRKSVV